MGSITVVFMSSLFSILRILLLVTFGIILARWGILNNQANSSLSKILFALFIPCIQFTNIASSISLDKLITMLNVIAFAIFYISMGAVLGWILDKIIHPVCYLSALISLFAETRLQTWHDIGNMYFIALSLLILSAIPNAGTLPLAVLAALLTREPMNTIQDSEPISIAYTSMYMSVASISLWTVGVTYIKRDEKDQQNYELLQVATSAPVTEVHENATKVSEESSNGHNASDKTDQQEISHSTEHNDNGHQHPSISHLDVESQQHQEQEEEGSESSIHSFFLASMDFVKDPWSHIPLSKERKQTLKNVLTPPVIAVMVALVVGLIPPLKWLFFSENSPFIWVSEAMETAAVVVVPTSLLILGGNLSNGPSSQLIEKKVVIGVCLCRLVLSPLLGLGTVLLAAKIGIIPPEDKILQFCLLLQTSSPSALNLVLISQLTGRQTAAQSMASLLFWEYVFSAISVTFFVSIFLYILF